jgi:alpha-tubulin suppressor-like RCC1 family protein
MKVSLIRVFCALGLVVGGVAVAALPASASKATSPPPTIASLALTPSAVGYSGGSVSVTADVTNSTTCRVSSNKPLGGLPATVPCNGGTVDVSAIAPVNSGTKDLTYVITLAASGKKTVHDKVDLAQFTRAGGDAVDLASDGSGSCAVLSNGGVDCWGVNSAGELGNGTTSALKCTDHLECYPTPQPVTGITNAVSVAGMTDSVNYLDDDRGSYCAVLSSGGVDCWGADNNGEIGSGPNEVPLDCDCIDTPQAALGITDAVAVVGDHDGYCAVLSSGGVDCWGYDETGEVGGMTDGQSCEENVASCYYTPQAVSGVTGAVMMANDGEDTNCAVLSSGGVDCWGNNDVGEVGDGAVGSFFSSPTTPQPVSGLTDAVQVAGGGIGAALSESFCAVLSSGGVDCWGLDNAGQLGNGTAGGSDQCEPTDEQGAGDYCDDTPQAVAGVSNVTGLASDGDGYCALLGTGGIDCWGSNTFGELGDGSIGGLITSQAVTGLSNAASVASDKEDGYCAVLTTGGVDCWGDNGSGQLGNGTVNGPDDCNTHDACYDTPQPSTGIADATSVTDQDTFSVPSYCSVLATGGVDCWGSERWGSLGNGNKKGTGSDVPVAVTYLGE